MVGEGPDLDHDAHLGAQSHLVGHDLEDELLLFFLFKLIFLTLLLFSNLVVEVLFSKSLGKRVGFLDFTLDLRLLIIRR